LGRDLRHIIDGQVFLKERQGKNKGEIAKSLADKEKETGQT
jgi:hypothetical protein